jgi:hypothetical protein
MRKFYLPLTVVGLAGLGLLLVSEAGQQAIDWLTDNWERTPERLNEWNDAAQRELDKIELALDQVAESLTEGFAQ